MRTEWAESRSIQSGFPEKGIGRWVVGGISATVVAMALVGALQGEVQAQAIRYKVPPGACYRCHDDTSHGKGMTVYFPDGRVVTYHGGMSLGERSWWLENDPDLAGVLYAQMRIAFPGREFNPDIYPHSERTGWSAFSPGEYVQKVNKATGEDRAPFYVAGPDQEGFLLLFLDSPPASNEVSSSWIDILNQQGFGESGYQYAVEVWPRNRPIWPELGSFSAQLQFIRFILERSRTDSKYSPYESGYWVCFNYAVQMILTYTDTGPIDFRINEELRLYDQADPKYRLPLYFVDVVFPDGRRHAIIAALVGQDPIQPDSWVIVEPQGDEITKPGSWSMPWGSTLKMSRILNIFADEKNQPEGMGSRGVAKFTADPESRQLIPLSLP